MGTPQTNHPEDYVTIDVSEEELAQFPEADYSENQSKSLQNQNFKLPFLSDNDTCLRKRIPKLKSHSKLKPCSKHHSVLCQTCYLVKLAYKRKIKGLSKLSHSLDLPTPGSDPLRFDSDLSTSRKDLWSCPSCGCCTCIRNSKLYKDTHTQTTPLAQLPIFRDFMWNPLRISVRPFNWQVLFQRKPLIPPYARPNNHIKSIPSLLDLPIIRPPTHIQTFTL